MHLGIDVAERSIAVLFVLVFCMAPLSGCLESDTIEQDSGPDHWLPPVEDLSDMIYRDDDVFSRVSTNGSYQIGEVK